RLRSSRSARASCASPPRAARSGSGVSSPGPRPGLPSGGSSSPAITRRLCMHQGAVAAPHERLILGLDAVLDLLDPHAMRFAVVLVHALVRALEEPDEAVLLVPLVRRGFVRRHRERSV